MPCDACPTPGRCYGDTGQLPDLCAWAARGWADRVARRNALPPPGETPPLPVVATPQPGRGISAFAFADRTARACPYRDHHCGCSLPTCHAGRGDHDDGQRASRDRCLACLKETWHLTPETST